MTPYFAHKHETSRPEQPVQDFPLFSQAWDFNFSSTQQETYFLKHQVRDLFSQSNKKETYFEHSG